MLTQGELERFWPKVGWPDVGARELDECWLWTAGRTPGGYGHFWREGHGPNQQAHRVMFEAMHGEIPEGLHVLHTCDNRACLNPLHLFLGTNADNVADRDRKDRGVRPETRGEANGNAKLTRQQVLEIRALVEEGETQRAVGRRFGLHQTTVGQIARRERWGWLEGGHCG